MKITDEKIMFAGDWHGQIDQAVRVLRAASANGISTIIQLGDFGIWPGNELYLDELEYHLTKRKQNLYFIDGNHEDFVQLYSYPLAEDGTRPIREGLTHLPRNFQFKWRDTRVTALGGAPSIDQKMRVPYVSWWPEETITEYEINVAQNLPPADLLLTHDSPAGAPNPVADDLEGQLLAAQFYGEGAVRQATAHREHLARVIPHLRPHMIIHGHYHAYMRGAYRPYLPQSWQETLVYSLDEGGASLDRHAVVLNSTLEEVHI